MFSFENVNMSEMLAFVLYMAIVLYIGIGFFLKTRSGGEKEYFLGGRNMGAWVSALSAGASDMSSWVLMGLPASIFVYGMGQVWIAIGLALGTALSWKLIAAPLRRFSIAADDSITVPQFLTNRFCSKRKILLVVSAIIFLLVYCVYSASSIKACGTLFNQVLGVDAKATMYVAAAIIFVYTFLGGFSAVCWTDFVQGMIMLVALMVTPVAALIVMGKTDAGVSASFREAFGASTNYWNLLSSGKFDWPAVSNILTGLGWGLGYFGMPHIIIRYMSIKSEKEVRRSAKIGTTWTTLILIMAVAVALVGKVFLPQLNADNSELVFIQMVRKIFPGFLAGILLSAILAAAMSTADSQLLASASAFASDVYKAIIHKNASDKEMNWVSRGVVLAVTVIAVLIAANPNSGTIMSLVGNAWGAFGAAFGPVILLSLYWKRMTYNGALAGVVSGFVVDLVWLFKLSDSTGVYEIIPGFIVGVLAAVVVSRLDKKPNEQIEALCKKAGLE